MGVSVVDKCTREGELKGGQPKVVFSGCPALKDHLYVDVVQRSVVRVVVRVSFGMSSAVVLGFIVFFSFSSVVVINGRSGWWWCWWGDAFEWGMTEEGQRGASVAGGEVEECVSL